MFALRHSGRQLVKTFATTQQQRFASSLVIAEHADGALKQSTLHTVTAASKIGGPVTVLVAGKDCSGVADQAAKVAGVESVICASGDSLDHAVAENITKLVEEVQAAKSFSHILTAATNEGKNILPRISAKLDKGAISDIISVENEKTFKRPMYAGNAIATVESTDDVVLVSVRTTAFEKAEAEGGSGAVENFESAADAGLAKWVSDDIQKSDRPEITAADTVIAGGRGLKNGENFELLYKLAEKVNGAVGASRAAVDAGFVPNDMQIGQTGKVCAPNLYVAVGISGAIQHLAGMKDSKCIVAINKDPEAPIFQVSDFGLEADLFNAVPELTEKI